MLPIAVTIFLSAFLLFLVQPIMARQLLPVFGGTPSVWTTCMLFFQIWLLLGYSYAHGIVRFLSLRGQLGIHAAVLIASATSLLFAFGGVPAAGAVDRPIRSIILFLMFSIGPCFFVLASTGPLLQSWFARRDESGSTYRLFALSNLGSLIALFGYPVFFEPTLKLATQITFWRLGYLSFAVGCLIVTARMASFQSSTSRVESPRCDGEAETSPQTRVVAPPTLAVRMIWLVLSFLPSVLLLSTTNAISQEVAVVPMLWVLPLGLYLLSFIICFDRPHWYRRDWYGILFLISTGGVAICMTRPTDVNYLVQLGAYLLLLFSACMCLHGELALRRPPTRHLTSYYLLIALGGALGGLFVVLGAPALFNGFYEFHLGTLVSVSLILVLWIWDGDSTALRRLGGKLGIFSSVGFVSTTAWGQGNADSITGRMLVAGFMITTPLGWLTWSRFHVATDSVAGINRRRPWQSLAWLIILAITVFVVSCLMLTDTWGQRLWPIAMVLSAGITILAWQSNRVTVLSGHLLLSLWGVAGLLALEAVLLTAGSLAASTSGRVIEQHRNFFGVSGVERIHHPVDGFYLEMFSGRTGHGRQYEQDPLRHQWNLYYGPTSGISLACARHPKRLAGQSIRIGIIGLGTGTLAMLGVAGDEIEYFEINPVVIDLADRYFSYLQDSPAQCSLPRCGDARVLLEQDWENGKAHAFDILVVDAFSSDAIPRHLLTREAIQIYRRHVNNDGIIAIHVTNWFLELRPVVADLADAVSWSYINVDDHVPMDTRFKNSNWMLITQGNSFLKDPAVVSRASRWTLPEMRIAWTDDFGSILQTLRIDRPASWPRRLWPFPEWNEIFGPTISSRHD